MSEERNRAISCARYIAALLVALNSEGGQIPKKPEEIGYRTVFTLAKRHSVAGAILSLIEDEILKTEDKELIDRFQHERELDCAKHLVQSREFASVCAAFAAADVRFLPIKGFLNKALWSRPEYRTMSDMDIYVGAEGMDRAAAVLLELGYKKDHAGDVHDSYMKPPYVNIELHRSLGSYGDGDFSLWRAKEGEPCHYLMSDEDFLVFALSHMYKHYKSGGTGMRSFFDLYLFLKKKGDALDARYVEREVAARDMTKFYAIAKRLSELWFEGGTECDAELAELEYYVITGGTFGTVENRVKRALKKKNRFTYALSRIFLPYSQMKFIYGWLKPLPFLLPIAWIARLFAALFDGRMRREVRATNAAAREKAIGEEAKTH